ncbi:MULTISPECIES: zonular occludens toxin domain-containing protein [Providencia]|uniref:zonular occludens toxin domain-containing protein n=2 Tax=Morganellaceae TaxID=1903414 RepID=UPI00065E2356|nr:zonular occludens toxin domain-containing protein [Providencia rettgeri]
MAVTLVTGALGAGKGLYCSMLACSAYRNSRRVAANYALDTTKLNIDGSEPVSVIPKQFTYDDLMNLGRGCAENEFENMGILLIDEVSLSLNARTFKDAERIKFIDWFVHSRKYGWDVYCQVQQSFMLDKQLVDGVAEFITELSRLDSLRIPFVTTFFELFFPKKFGRTAKKKSLLPHLVRYRTYLIKEKGRKTAIEKGSFRAKDFFGVHDTLSTFGADSVSQGAYSLLSAKQLNVKKTQLKSSKFKFYLKALFQLLLIILIPITLFFYWFSYDEELDVISNPDHQIKQSISTTQHVTATEKKQLEEVLKDPVPLSSSLRLIGQITTRGQTKIIIRDMQTGLVRYVDFYSINDVKRIDSIEIEGEKVTFYSGSQVFDKNTQNNRTGEKQ